ncbi:MAG: beta-galactosidase, partial [Victivallales bacterium]|nr:beta-galactosidase [Victivallales bacterium]
LGDNFGFTNTVDVENNALKQLKKKYDVVVVAGIPWTVLSDDAVAALLEQVRGGTGLLLIGKQPNQPFVKNAGAAVRGIPVFKTASPASSGVPFDTFTQLSSLSFPVTEGVLAVNGAAPALIEGTMGKGRWLFYNYDTTNSFGWAPEYSAFPDKIERTEADFHYAMLAKGILYAAGIKLPVELGDFTAAEGKAALKVNAAAPVKANAEVRVLSTGGVCTASAVIPVALKAGEQTIDFGAMLPKYDGKQIFSVILRDEAGKSLNWGAWSFTNVAPARIISVSTGGKTQFAHGDNVEWSAQLNAGEGFKLRAELVDSYQRVIARQESAAVKQAKGALKLENALLSRRTILRLTLWDGAAEIYRSEMKLLTRPAEALLDWDDYEVCTWINLGVRRFLWPEMSEMMRRFRLRTIISNTGRYGVELPVEYNFHPTVLRGSGLYRCPEPAEYAKTGNKLVLVRKPCISNHEHISSLAKKFVTYGKDSYAHSMRFIWLGDELSLTGYGGAPTDFCFSPDCQEALREFLKKKYTTLEKLNSVWNTSFAKWEDVISSTKDEIWKGDGKNIVSWSDRLEFLDGQVENLIAAALKSGQTQDPGMRLSLSGTQKPSAYGGTDWYRLCRQLTTLMNYNGAGSYELHRSFSSRALLAPWALGYSNRGAAVPHNIWNSVLLGNYGISAWHYPTMVNPDFTLFDGMESAVPHLQKLSDGLGRYLLNHQQGKAKVAVLYSQASMRNAFIRHRTEANDAIREKYILMLRTLGVHFDFVSYEHLAKGLSEQYTVLILPDSNALSQAEVDSVRAFKGAVMAEGIPGEYHADCRPRDKAPLSDVMAKKGNLLIPTVDVSYNKKALYPSTDANYAAMSAELNRMGKFLVDAGVAVRPMKAVDTANGKVVVDASCYVREAADGAKLYGIVTTTMAQRMIKFSFPEKGHLYDVVTGAYLGHTDSVELPFSKGQPRAFVFRKD